MEPKTKIKRSRNGCHKCKSLKVKCDEKKPSCSACLRAGRPCDYSIKLTWGGPSFRDTKRRKVTNSYSQQIDFGTNKETSEQTREQTNEIQNQMEKQPTLKSARTSKNGPNFQFTKPKTVKKADFASFIGDTVQTPNTFSSNSESLFVGYDKSGEPQTLNNPNIYDGIESLSHALLKIVNGDLFQLQNSEIFNNYMSNSKADTKDEIGEGKVFGQVEMAGELKTLSDDSLSDYSEDLARIDQLMPERLPNFLSDLMSPNPLNLLFQRTARAPRIEDFEDFEDIEEIVLETTPESLYDQIVPYGPYVYSELGIEKNAHVATPEELFSSVPAEFMPLPEILLHVPYYRNLMHFWVDVASEHLVPAPAHIYEENPFKVILPRMAMEYPSILTTLLAFSASIRSTLIPDSGTQETVINQLLSRLCAELLKLLLDKKSATSDSALATVLLLSCYEQYKSRDFDKHRVHTLGARQIIMARTSNVVQGLANSSQASNLGTESDIAFFLLRWFVYIDIIGALSATKNNHQYLASTEKHNDPLKSLEIINEQLEDSTLMDPKRDIDHLLGFDVKFLPHFSEIALLITKTDAYLESVDNAAFLPMDIIQQALEVKHRLMSAFEAGERRRQQQLDEIIDIKTQKKKQDSESTSPPNLSKLIHQDVILRCTNKMFCYMGLISLYRRVLRIPRHSELVQDLVASIASIGEENIVPRSPADICTIFCSFTAGCEALDDAHRAYFDVKFAKLSEMGNVNALKGSHIMKRCWETGEDWIDASKHLDIDISLL